MKIHSKRLASLVLGGVMAAGVALADGAGSTTVSFQDLDLGTAAGVAKLYSRIHAAAGNVCGAEAGIREIVRLNQQEACIRAAEEGAVRRMSFAPLTAYYQSKTGRPVAMMAAN